MEVIKWFVMITVTTLTILIFGGGKIIQSEQESNLLDQVTTNLTEETALDENFTSTEQYSTTVETFIDVIAAQVNNTSTTLTDTTSQTTGKVSELMTTDDTSTTTWTPPPSPPPSPSQPEPVGGLKCYVCNSVYHQNCDVTDPTPNTLLVPCTPETAFPQHKVVKPKLPFTAPQGTNFTFCRKNILIIKTKDPNEQGNVTMTMTRTIRSCGYLGMDETQPTKIRTSCQWSYSSTYEYLTCLCDTDGCNGAGVTCTFSIFIYIQIITLTMAIVNSQSS